MKNWLPALLVHAAGHTNHAAGVLDGVVDAVGSKLTLDVPARAAGTVAQRAAALDHEAGDDTVEGQAVIEALADQLLEILTGDGSGFLVQLNVDDAAVFHSNANHSCTILLYFGPLQRAFAAEDLPSDRDSIS